MSFKTQATNKGTGFLGGQSSGGKGTSGASQDKFGSDITAQADVELFAAKNIGPIPQPHYADDERFDQDRIIPISAIEIDSLSYDSMMDLFESRVFERQLDDFQRRLIYQKMVDLDSDGVISAAIQSVDEEIELEREKLNSAMGLFTEIQATQRSMIDPERMQQVQIRYNKLIKQNDENPIVAIPDDIELDYFKSISSMTTIPEDDLRGMLSTQLFLQLLDDLRFYFVKGSTAKILLPPSMRPESDIADGGIDGLYHVYNDIPGTKWLQNIGMSKSNSGTDFTLNHNPYARLPNRKDNFNLKRVAGLCSQLANEFRLSAGLGRVQSMKEAKEFGVSLNKAYPFHNMCGTKHVNHYKTDSKVPGSLADFAVVSRNGSTRESFLKNVALLDPYIPLSNFKPDFLDTKTAFFDTVRNNPANNNMAEFDNIMVLARQRFDLAEQTIVKATLSDQELNLLSPQGLFVRVLEEFKRLLTILGMEANETTKTENLTGLHLLSVAALATDNTADSYTVLLKRRLTTLACRLLSKHRTSTGLNADEQVRLSSLEGSKNYDWHLVEELNYDKKVLFQILTTYSHDASFLSDDPEGDGLGYSNAASSAVADAFAKADQKKRQGFSRVAQISGGDMVDASNDSDDTGGWLRGIVAIFEEMEKEAIEMAKVDGPSTFTNINRLTNNGGFDAAIAISMIIECFCLLAKDFIRTRLILGEDSDDPEGKVNDLSLHMYSDFILSYRAAGLLMGNSASQAIGGSEIGEDIVNVFSMTTTGQTISGQISKIKQGHSMGSIGAISQMNQMKHYTSEYGSNSGKALVDVKDPEGGSSFGNYVHGQDTQTILAHYLTGVRNRMAETFLAGTHTILYEGGPHSNLDTGQKCLGVIIEAAKEGDLDSLFDDPQNKANTFLALNGALDYNASMAAHSSYFTPSSLVSLIESVSEAHVAPTRLFYAAKAMIQYLDETSLNLSKKAAVMRGKKSNSKLLSRHAPTDLTDQEKALASLASSDTGKNLIRLMSNRQLDICESRLNALENADAESAYLISDVPETTVKAMRIIMEKLKTVPKGKIIFLGLPAGKLEGMIDYLNSSAIAAGGFDSELYQPDIGPALNDRSLEIKFYMQDQIQTSAKFNPITVNFPLDLSIDHAGIAVAFESDVAPKSLQQLVRYSEFEIDSPLTTEKFRFLGSDLLVKYQMRHLESVMRSFLLKTFAGFALDHSVFEEELMLTAVNQRQTSARSAMQLAADALGVEKAKMNKLFGTQKSIREPAKNNMKLVSKDKEFSLSDAEALLDIFCTKPFFAGDVANVVSRPSQLDYVYGVFIDDDAISLNEDATKNEVGQAETSKSKNFKDFKKIKDANFANKKDSVQIKSLYCKAQVVKQTYKKNEIDDITGGLND